MTRRFVLAAAAVAAVWCLTYIAPIIVMNVGMDVSLGWRDPLMTWSAVLTATFAALTVIVTLARWARNGREGKIDGDYALQFVLIEDDGTAWELEPDDIEYLNTEFEGADGDRPYIKSRYRSLDSGKRIGGYLLRRLVPARVRIRPTSERVPITTPEAAIDIAREHFVRWLGPRGASPDEPFSAALAGELWRVTGTWAIGGGAFWVELSAITGRIKDKGETPSRTYSIPLGGY